MPAMPRRCCRPKSDRSVSERPTRSSCFSSSSASEGQVSAGAVSRVSVALYTGIYQDEGAACYYFQRRHTESSWKVRQSSLLKQRTSLWPSSAVGCASCAVLARVLALREVCKSASSWCVTKPGLTSCALNNCCTRSGEQAMLEKAATAI